ncbi:MAG: L-alanine-DL-glutamate epimerase related enzymes of enolase superfamily [Halonotius sp. J07HN4]|nr:MAG: L-alanine-DL-glutamate epimerase related enzymes of enolase superfamily [Halonotius sp. J07HN4]
MWVEPFSLTLDAPLSTARGEITERRGFLVGSDGGLGEATPLAGWTESYEACKAALKTAASDDGSPDPAATPAAAHAIELAKLDARGRRKSRPLASLCRHDAFGSDGSIPARVPVNATVGDGDRETTVAAAEHAVSEGFDCLKLKIGSRPVDSDIDRIRAVRAAVGSTVDLRVDANGAWDAATAEQALDSFADIGVDYVEQPLSADELDGHRRLRGRGVDIALDESVAETSPSAVIDADAADVVILKPMAVGGPLRATRTAAAAREAGIEPVVTTTIDAVVARTAAVHVAAAIPEVAACGLATGSLLAEDLAADPVTIREGAASVPTAGGLCGDAFETLH